MGEGERNGKQTNAQNKKTKRKRKKRRKEKQVRTWVKEETKAHADGSKCSERAERDGRRDTVKDKTAGL